MLSRLMILSAIVPLSIWADTTYTWAGTSTTWTTDANWTPNSGYPGSNYPTSIDTAVFPTGTVNVMPNLVSAITLTEISFTAGNYEITNNSNSDFLTFVSSGGTAPSIMMSAGVTSNNTIFPPIVLDSNLIITNDSTTAQLYISSPISNGVGSNSITVMGATTSSIINFGGTNSFSGVTIESGTFQAGSIASLPPNASLSIGAGAVLDLNAFSNTVASITGAGTITSSSGGTPVLTITNGLGNTSSAIFQDGVGVSLSAGALTLSGNISGAGGVAVSGGTLTITAASANSYSGTTTVSNTGVLSVNSANALSPNSAIILQSSGELDLTGSLVNYIVPSLNSTDSGTSVLGNGNTLTVNGGTSSSFAGQLTDLGVLVLSVTGTELTLSNGNNTITGTGAEINSGTSLFLSGLGQLGSTCSVQVLGTTSTALFDISAVNSSVTIGNLIAGSTDTDAVVNLGSKTLILTTSGSRSYYGAITGTNGSLTANGTGTWSLFGTGLNTYSGTTTVGSGVTFTAGAASVFSPNSNFVVSGTLALGAFSNTVASLSGAGNVTSSAGATLTVSNGSNGSTYGGIYSGPGGLTLNAGVLTLTNANTYTGPTIINGGTVALSGAGTLATATPFTSVTVDGILDLSDMNANSQTIANLQGDGEVILENNTLVVIPTQSNVYNGTITGPGGSFTYTGTTNTLTFGVAGSDYTGTTTINSGTVAAGVANAFSPNSAYDVVSPGILSLGGFSNTINGLSGSGTVSLGAGLLTLNAGGNFSGAITGTGGAVTLTSGTLVLTGASNTYSGTTTVTGGTTILEYGASSALSPNSPIALFDGATLSNGSSVTPGTFSTTIFSLNGDSTTSVLLGSSGTLTIAHGGLFEGIMSGGGGIDTGTGGSGALTLTNVNTFTGEAAISSSGGGLILTGLGSINDASSVFAAGLFDITGISADSAMIQNLFSNPATGTINLGDKTLVITTTTPEIFYGGINGTGGGITVQGSSSLELEGTNTYTGPTLVDGTATLLIGGTSALSPNTAVTIDSGATLNISAASSAVSISNAGTLIENAPLTLANFYTQTGTLDMATVTGDPDGLITVTNGNATLAGTLNITNTSGNPASGVAFMLLSTPAGSLNNTTFGTVTYAGFTPNPSVVYDLQSVNLVFGACTTNFWTGATNSFWDVQSNWSSTSCIPGVNGNNNDIANFTDATPTTNNVTIADATGMAIPLTLYQLVFGTAGTSYTITQESSASIITFNSTIGAPQIVVTAGSHTLSTPIVLAQNTNVVLSDGTALTLGPDTTLTSILNQSLTVQQGAGSGSGLLINDTILTPYSMNVLYGSVQNNTGDKIIPINSLTVGAIAGKNVTVTNSGIGALIGVTGINGSAIVGGAGTTTVTNSGTGAAFGPTGLGGSMTIGSTGTTTVTNSGTGAAFGPTGLGGTMTIGSSGTTTVTNSGTGATFGTTGLGGTMTIGSTGTTIVTNNGILFGSSGTASNVTVQGAGTTISNSGLAIVFGAIGTGSNVTITGGSIMNTSGALIQAGPGGVLTISGGSVTNDITSTVGTTSANLDFTGGTLTTSGNVLAANYTQSGTSILQLNITSPTEFGNVAASEIASVGGTLVVDDINQSVTSGQTYKLVTAGDERLGEYSTVDYVNFAAGFIPQIVYGPNFVELVASSAVTSNGFGSLSQMQFTSVNEGNIFIQRTAHRLHERIKKRKAQAQENESGEVVTQLGLIREGQEPQLAENAGESLAYVHHAKTLPIIQTDKGDDEVVQLGFSRTNRKQNQLAESVELGFSRTNRKQHQLAENVGQHLENPSRFYIGPIDTLGTFKSNGTSQTGFKFNSIGLLAGADHAFDSFGLGFVTEYQSNHAHLNRNSGHIHMNQLQGNAYAIWVPSSLSELSVDAIVGYGYDWIKVSRKAGPAVAPVTPKAKPQGELCDALLGVEYIFENRKYEAMPRNFLVTPFFNLQYIWTKVDGFKEQGGGVNDLRVSRQLAKSLKTTLATRLEYILAYENFTFNPELDLGWQYEFLDKKRGVNFSTPNLAQVQSISASVVGAGRNTFLLGVDFFFTICKVFELELMYDLQWNSVYVNNNFYIGIGGNF